MRNIPSIHERMRKFWALYIVPLFMLAGAGGNSGGRLENQCCVGGGSNSWASAGTNGEWLRFFWDRYTNVSDTCADWPMKLDMLKLYQMVLNKGTADGKRYLSEAAVEKMTRNHTGELRAGFTDGIVMGLGWQIVGTPTGVTEMLAPGTYGHGGAFGTQGWIDPKKEMIFILMVQRSGFPNGDASDLRKSLQSIAVAAIKE